MDSDFKDFFNQKGTPDIEIHEKGITYGQKTPIIINATQTITANHNLYINNVLPTQTKENSETRNETEGTLIKSPRLELLTTNSKNEKEQQLIIVTPNSINNVIKKTGEKFLFGKNDLKMKNDYNFYDDSVGVRQFEITFEKCKSYN
jgi:hypothetical protein